MEIKTTFVAIILALASSSAAIPGAPMKRMNSMQTAKLAWTVDQRMLAAFECRGQSCMIADTAGSTGRDPIMKAEGADDNDIQCIIKHNPAVGELLRKYNNQVPNVPKQSTTWMSTAMSSLNKGLKSFSNPRETGTFAGTCAPNILIFAKGTLEPGILGITVGPQFTSGLPSNWSTAGVDYDPDVAGDYCLGLPGGMVMKDVINGAYQKCPSSNLFLSGYSQGAMVVRNGLARANDAAKKNVKVRLL
jgi:Cutinase